MEKNEFIEEQINGFLNTSPLFRETDHFELFPFRGKEGLNSPMDVPEISERLVLGKRMEIFFETYLRSLGKYEIIASGIQVIHDKVTIGELDFLVRELDSRQVTHLELVYKFYLYDPSKETEPEKWVGPNKRDSLSHKIQKLKEKQLPLLHDNPTIQILGSLGIKDEVISQKVCFLGQLYVPYSHRDIYIPNLNNNAIQGYWLTLNDFTKTHTKGDMYHIPEKENWVMDASAVKKWATLTEIKIELKKFMGLQKSKLCFKKSTLEEYSRCFVVWW